jgi:hypothetical protein
MLDILKTRDAERGKVRHGKMGIRSLRAKYRGQRAGIGACRLYFKEGVTNSPRPNGASCPGPW